jgi:hypothetical protein
MRDVSSIEPQAVLFGVKSALPIYVSPASNALLGHPGGELNITRGVGPPFSHSLLLRRGADDRRLGRGLYKVFLRLRPSP